MAHSLHLRVELGEPRQVWCDGCLTSARVEADLLHLGDTGMRVLGTYVRCLNCGVPNPEAPSPASGGET